jgi:SAM-dependent methyltransferase
MKNTEKVFGRRYANVYDLFYAEKKYDREFNLIKKRLKAYEFDLVDKTILEIGCGTGNFSVNLGEDNKLIAIDKSKEMIDIAKRKLKNLEKSFYCSTLSDFYNLISRKQNFDLIILLFHVFSYLSENDIKLLIKLSKSKLNKGGFLVFDYWDRQGTTQFPPGVTVKCITQPRSKFIRVANPIKTQSRLNCTIFDIEVTFLKSYLNGKVKIVTSEIHRLRAYDSHYLDMLMRDFTCKENFDLLSGKKYSGQAYGNCKIYKYD